MTHTYKAHWMVIGHMLQVPPMKVEVVETRFHQCLFWYVIPGLLQDTADVQQVLGYVEESVPLGCLTSEKIPKQGNPFFLYGIINAVGWSIGRCTISLNRV